MDVCREVGGATYHLVELGCVCVRVFSSTKVEGPDDKITVGGENDVGIVRQERSTREKEGNKERRGWMDESLKKIRHTEVTKDGNLRKKEDKDGNMDREMK